MPSGRGARRPGGGAVGAGRRGVERAGAFGGARVGRRRTRGRGPSAGRGWRRGATSRRCPAIGAAVRCAPCDACGGCGVGAGCGRRTGGRTGVACRYRRGRTAGEHRRLLLAHRALRAHRLPRGVVRRAGPARSGTARRAARRGAASAAAGSATVSNSARPAAVRRARGSPTGSTPTVMSSPRWPPRPARRSCGCACARPAAARPSASVRVEYGIRAGPATAGGSVRGCTATCPMPECSRAPRRWELAS